MRCFHDASWRSFSSSSMHDSCSTSNIHSRAEKTKITITKLFFIESRKNFSWRILWLIKWLTFEPIFGALIEFSEYCQRDSFFISKRNCPKSSNWNSFSTVIQGSWDGLDHPRTQDRVYGIYAQFSFWILFPNKLALWILFPWLWIPIITYHL